MTHELTAVGHRIGVLALALGLALAGCSSEQHRTSQTPAAASTDSTPTHHAATPTSSAPAVPDTVSVPGSPDDWSIYAGTFFKGCPAKLNQDLNDITPQIFDVAAGRLVHPGAPPTDATATLDGVACALTGTSDDLKVVYVVATSKEAKGLQAKSAQVSASIFDIDGTKPIVTADISAVVPTGAAIDSISGIATGLVIKHDNRTTVLSNRDLTVLWTDPEVPDCIAPDALVFTRPNPRDAVIDDGVEVRSATGEVIFNDAMVGYGCNAVLYDGPTHLIQFNRFDTERSRFIDSNFFDVDKRAYIQTDDFMHHVADASLTLSNGRIFVVNSELGTRVWNIATGQVEYSKSAEQYGQLDVDKVFFFDNHLYLINTGDSPSRFSVYTLPDEKQIGGTWTQRPTVKLNGWTIAIKGPADDTGNGCRYAEWNDACKVMAVRDQNGGYPGPWN